MKNTFKKIVSLALTVLMVAGMFTMLVPTASAADDYVTITPNTDFVHNGVTYRFDVRDGNTNSYARILADGSIEMKYSYGDILWFPEIKMTDTSALHAEVTAIAHDSDSSGMGNTFMGIVYGATEKADGSFNTGVAGILRTAGRARVVCISRDNLTSLSGGNYGSGGGTQIFNAGDFKNHANYASVKSSNNDWGFNKTIKFDVSRVDDQVTFAMSSADGEFFTTSYDNASYAYAGAVGWTSIWANNAGYKTYRFDKLTLTNCTVNNEAKDTYTVFERKEASGEPVDPPSDIIKEVITGKTDVKINDITMRMDYPTPSHASASLTLCSDGSVIIKGNRGDLFWMPNVEITENSVITTTVTMDSASDPLKASAGTIFNVDANGAWDADADTAIIAALRPYNGNSRRSLGALSYKSSVNSADYTKILSEVNYTPTNTNFGNTWALGASVTTTISKKADGTVEAVFTDSNGDFIIDASYNDAQYPFEGAVGYMTHWSNSADYYEYTISEYTITNALVNGKLVEEFDLAKEIRRYFGVEEDIVKEQIAGKTDVKINDITMRMDYPTPSHASAALTLCSDGSVIIKGNRGDLFWLPGVEATSNSVITTTVTMDSASDPLKASAGTVFNIDADGAWDADADKAIIAALRPYNGNSRRSLGAITYKTAVNSADYSNILSEVNYTPTNTNFGNTWALGTSVTTTISKNANGDVTAVFTDSNGDFIIDASYNNDAYPLEGAVGYMTHWSNSSEYYQYTISEFKVTNAIVNGELVEEFDLAKEIRRYFGTSNEGVDDAKVSLSLDGTIGLNFAFYADNALPEGATVVGTKEGVEVVNQAVVDGENVVTVPVAAKEMTDDVNFSIMVDGVVFEDHSYTTSVAAYAAELKKNADWAELIGSMLNYGAAAQKLLNYKADALAPDASADVDYDFTSFKAVEFSGDKSILAGLFINLSLESDTTLKIYVKMADGTMPTVTVNGKAADLTDNGDGYYILAIDGIAADKLDDDFAIVVNGQLSFGVNALDWARLADNNADEDVANAARALAAYGEAAGKKF